MRPLRAAFKPNYDPENDPRALSPVAEAQFIVKPAMSQEKLGMQCSHRKTVKAMLAGSDRGVGAIARKGRSISTARDAASFPAHPNIQIVGDQHALADYQRS